MKRSYGANIQAPPALRDSRRHFGTIGSHFAPPPLLPPPRLVEAAPGVLPLPPRIDSAPGFHSRSAGMPPPPPPPPQLASPSGLVKVEAPRAPHLYPSQSLFPRDSAATDAMIGLKTLATHAGTQAHIGTPPRVLQLPYHGHLQPQHMQPPLQQHSQHMRPTHSYGLPALHIPHPQQCIDQARAGGDPATPVRPVGGPLQQSLLPPPVITRRVIDTQRQQPSDVRSSPATDGLARQLPSMAQSPPLVSLLGRKNKRGEPRVQGSAPSGQVWDRASQDRLDPTASPPRPMTSPPRYPPSKVARRTNLSVTKPLSGTVTTVHVPSSSPVARPAAPGATTRSISASATANPPPLVRRVSNGRWRHELAPRDRAKTRERIQRGLHKQCHGDYDALAIVLAAMEEELVHIRASSREHFFDQARELSSMIASAQLEPATMATPSPSRPSSAG